jgi:hypothetical protein
MNESQEHILKMVSSGAITAEEADRLLNAMDETAEVPVGAEPINLDGLPDVESLRERWQFPFVVSLGVMAFSGRRILARRRGFFGKLLLPLDWMAFSLGAVGVMISLWSRSARWLYVHIVQRDGREIRLTLPVPAQTLGGLLRRTSRFGDPESREQMLAAADFLEAIHEEMDSPEGAPLVIDIHDEGQQVQVYLL